MAEAKSVVGLDVRAMNIVAVVLDAESGELRTFGLNGDAGVAAVFWGGLPRPVGVAYEAGPTGYGLARELVARCVECVVAAPSKIPRAAGDRVKADRRDGELLVRLLLAGELHAVRVRGPEEEALGDLVRAREAVRVDLMRCRRRLSKLLLGHGIRFDDGPAWAVRHRDWLAQVALEWPAAQATMLDAQGAIDALVYRREQLGREIVALVPGSRWAVQVGRLRCLRGIDTLSAVGLCAEIGDFERFARAKRRTIIAVAAARENRLSNPPYQSPATPDARQRRPTTNHGPAAPTRVYQPDRASRTACRTATHPADHTTRSTSAQSEKSSSPS